MSTTLAAIADRVASVCAGAPFRFVQSADEFTFSSQPAGLIDQSYRIEAGDVSVAGGFNYTETRIGQLRVFLARRLTDDVQAGTRQLRTDAHSMTAAIVRDGLQGGGDYDVPDAGRGFAIQHQADQEYAVLRLTLPVNYDAQL